MLRIVPADEGVVRDVELARAGEVRENAGAYVFEAALLDRQPLRAGDELRPGGDRDLCVPERQPLEIGVIGRLHVEEREVSVAVEDDLAVPRRLDGDRHVGRAIGREVVRAVERDRAIDGGVVRVS